MPRRFRGLAALLAAVQADEAATQGPDAAVARELGLDRHRRNGRVLGGHTTAIYVGTPAPAAAPEGDTA